MLLSIVTIKDWHRMAKEADFHPAKMAAACSISKRHLERHFQEQFNMTPRQWLRQVQCELAKNLVVQGWPTKAVANELKFADGSHFCHEFKKYFGASPRTFARAAFVTAKDVAAEQ